MLKRIALAVLAPVYQETSQVIAALKAGVGDWVWRLNGNRVQANKSAFTVRPVGGTGRRLERNGP